MFITTKCFHFTRVNNVLLEGGEEEEERSEEGGERG